jgi:hypothetical protein
MRVWISDASRVVELRDFLHGLRAIAVAIEANRLNVHLINEPARLEERRLRAYLATWSRLYGGDVELWLEGDGGGVAARLEPSRGSAADNLRPFHFLQADGAGT